MFNNASGIFYAITYLAMFALPFALKDVPVGVRIVSASGFLMTLLYVALSIFPIVEVGSRALFTTKICGVIVLGNLGGSCDFRSGAARGEAADGLGFRSNPEIHSAGGTSTQMSTRHAWRRAPQKKLIFREYQYNTENRPTRNRPGFLVPGSDSWQNNDMRIAILLTFCSLALSAQTISVAQLNLWGDEPEKTLAQLWGAAAQNPKSAAARLTCELRAASLRIACSRRNGRRASQSAWIRPTRRRNWSLAGRWRGSTGTSAKRSTACAALPVPFQWRTWRQLTCWRIKARWPRRGLSFGRSWRRGPRITSGRRRIG